jgi:hypothetical protein
MAQKTSQRSGNERPAKTDAEITDALDQYENAAQDWLWAKNNNSPSEVVCLAKDNVVTSQKNLLMRACETDFCQQDALQCHMYFVGGLNTKQETIEWMLDAVTVDKSVFAMRQTHPDCPELSETLEDYRQQLMIGEWLEAKKAPPGLRASHEKLLGDLGDELLRISGWHGLISARRSFIADEQPLYYVGGLNTSTETTIAILTHFGRDIPAGLEEQGA